MRRYNLGGLPAAFDAVESMRRQSASEFGQYGIRVITLQTLIGRVASLEDVGNVAVVAASDRARTMTGRQST
jgi:3-oxoacyl-[acyl-carrier protein] reductase